jgi:hypothetical protein
MSSIRNILINFRAFWLDLDRDMVAVPLRETQGQNHFTGDSVLDTIALGVMTSMDRALADSFGGKVTATLTAANRKPERSSGVDLVWPTIACITTAAIVAPMRRKTGDAG